MNSTTSSGLTGAASGATMGFSVGGPWGAAVGGIVGGVVGIFSGASNDAQYSNSQAWNTYNAQMGYDTALMNIQSNLAISRLNASLISGEAKVRNYVTAVTTNANVSLLDVTRLYNDSLLEAEELNLWNSVNLDLHILAKQRAAERGNIIATQAASGTVIGEGTNQDIVEAQMTQEALDAFVIRHGANIQAGKISDARARGSWETDVQIEKVKWEGKLSQWATNANAAMNVQASLAGAGITAIAGMQSASNQLMSGMAGISQGAAAYDTSNSQQLTRGLFSAAEQGVVAYANTPSYVG